MKRPNHATIVAYLALFTALGGSAYAAATIGSKEIKDNSIRSRDVRNQTLTGKDINERSLETRPNVYRKSVTVRATAGRVIAIAPCNPGDLAISGGASGATRALALSTTGPLPKLNGWVAEFDGTPAVTGGESPTVIAVCARKPRM
jgi:hypothetical protein